MLKLHKVHVNTDHFHKILLKYGLTESSINWPENIKRLQRMIFKNIITTTGYVPYGACKISVLPKTCITVEKNQNMCRYTDMSRIWPDNHPNCDRQQMMIT